MNEELDELTEAERRALEALPSESDLPQGLEDRVVEALQGHGLVAGRPSAAFAAAASPAGVASKARTGPLHRWRLAAAAALFVSGAGAGWLARSLDVLGFAHGGPDARAHGGPDSRARGGSATPDSLDPLFMLLLFPGPGYTPGGPADEAARVAEYGAWAGRLAREGRLVSAEKLREGALVLEPGGRESASAAGLPQGFFLVRARSLEEAQALARACPHLGHGGRVAVQAVDPT